MEEIKTKVCHKCGRELTIDHFCKCSRSKDGLQSVCKSCQVEYNRNRQKYIKSLILQSEQIKVKPEAIERRATEKVSELGTAILAKFTPRQLMMELKRRGYGGTLTFTQEIDLAKIND